VGEADRLRNSLPECCRAATEARRAGGALKRSLQFTKNRRSASATASGASSGRKWPQSNACPSTRDAIRRTPRERAPGSRVCVRRRDPRRRAADRWSSWRDSRRNRPRLRSILRSPPRTYRTLPGERGGRGWARKYQRNACMACAGSDRRSPMAKVGKIDSTANRSTCSGASSARRYATWAPRHAPPRGTA
jgi:hypothetical protein